MLHSLGRAAARLLLALGVLALAACQRTPPSLNPDTDPMFLLPDSAERISQISAELDGQEGAEEILLAGFGGAPGQLGYDFLQLFVLSVDEGGRYVVAWQSAPLAGDRGEALQARDLEGDGLPEVISIQATGAAGEMAYIVDSEAGTYALLTPHGGYFEGQPAFGEAGVQFVDRDGDGLVEILAMYGPSASKIDVYRWDGTQYTFAGREEP